MSVDRRRFLAGCSSAGLLAASPAVAVARALDAPAPATAATLRTALDRPLLVLHPGDDALFAAAAVRTARRAGLARIDVIDITRQGVHAPGTLRAALAARRGTTLLGLLDDCAHTLLEECLRDLGGSVLCRGQHFGDLRALADSRHLFSSTPATRGIGQALAGSLAAGPGAYLVREQAPPGGPADNAASTARLDPHWATALGIVYARMAAGQWQPARLITQARRGTVAASPTAQPRVSLFATV